MHTLNRIKIFTFILIIVINSFDLINGVPTELSNEVKEEPPLAPEGKIKTEFKKTEVPLTISSETEDNEKPVESLGESSVVASQNVKEEPQIASDPEVKVIPQVNKEVSPSEVKVEKVEGPPVKDYGFKVKPSFQGIIDEMMKSVSGPRRMLKGEKFGPSNENINKERSSIEDSNVTLLKDQREKLGNGTKYVEIGVKKLVRGPPVTNVLYQNGQPVFRTPLPLSTESGNGSKGEKRWLWSLFGIGGDENTTEKPIVTGSESNVNVDPISSPQPEGKDYHTRTIQRPIINREGDQPYYECPFAWNKNKNSPNNPSPKSIFSFLA